MTRETVQSSINIPRELKEEFKGFVQEIEGKSKGAYSDHIQKAMRFYMRKEKNPSKEEVDDLSDIARSLDRIERGLGISERKYDREYLVRTLSERFPKVDEGEIEDSVESYIDHDVPPGEIITAVSERMQRDNQDEVMDLNSLQMGDEGVTVEVNVTNVFGASSKSSSGIIADRTDSMRFHLDYDGFLEKDNSYRLNNATVVKREDIEDEEDSGEWVLKIDDEDLVNELNTHVSAHGGGRQFETGGMIVALDTVATRPSTSNQEARVVAFLDTGTRVCRVFIDEYLLRKSVLTDYTGDIDGEQINMVRERLLGRYYSITGFDNTGQETEGRSKFSGVVVAEMRRGMNRLWESNLNSPQFPEDDKKPGVRLFAPEIELVDEVFEEDASSNANLDAEKVDYVITPIGGHEAGKILIAGTLTRVEKTGDATRGYLNDATGTTLQFLISDRYAGDIGGRLRGGITPPTRIFVRGSIKQGDNGLLLNVRDLGEIDEYTEETWVREAVQRTQVRLRNPRDENQYETLSEGVWRDIRDRLHENYGADVA
jgi:RPA family protein